MIKERRTDEGARWTMPGPEAGRRTRPSCVMAAAEGPLQGGAIFAARKGAPPWQQVAMRHRRAAKGEDAIAPACRARAGQAEKAPCASIRARRRLGWRLIRHRQTVASA